jgi:hypothetical protein
VHDRLDSRRARMFRRAGPRNRPKLELVGAAGIDERPLVTRKNFQVQLHEARHDRESARVREASQRLASGHRTRDRVGPPGRVCADRRAAAEDSRRETDRQTPRVTRTRGDN